LFFALSQFISEPVSAEDFRLLSLSARLRLSNATTIGDDQPEKAQGYDVAAHVGMPWQYFSESGWGSDTRLMLSAGFIRSAKENGLVVSFVPMFGLQKKGVPIVLDGGAGFALFSRDEFGTQDYGGPFQFALTGGVSFPLYRQFGLGYRFMHYSDAAVNGENTTGADFHMAEFYWRY
jgi:hypothetical protein